MSDQMANFDTHLFAKRLKGSGFNEQQVDDLVEMAKAWSPATVVTRPILRDELTILEQRMTIQLSSITAGLLAVAVTVTSFLG